MTRREMMALSAMTVGTAGWKTWSAHAAEPAAAENDRYEWIKSCRALIAEAYNPPFYPSLDYEPQRAVANAVELNCNAFRYPAASYYAYFPTKSGYPVHPDLKGDPMRETVALLRKKGLRTIAYVPLNHGFMSVKSTDPRYSDWTRKYADGRPIVTGHYGFGEFYEGCLNSPLREVIRKLTAEVLSYDFDVMYFDGPYQGMQQSAKFCHCHYCVDAYRGRFHLAIPDEVKAPAEDRARYITWMRDEVAQRFFQELRDMIRSTRDVPVLFNNTALLQRNDQWRSHSIAVADGFMFEAAETPTEKLFNLELGKSTGKTIWTYVGHHTQYGREHLKDKSVRSWFSFPVEGEELLLDGAIAMAAGVGSVYWGASRFFYEREPALSFESGRLVREIFDLQQKHEALVRDLKYAPQVGIAVGDQTINWLDDPYFVRSAYPNYFHGAFNLLKSMSVDAEPFLDWMLSPDVLRQYRAVFLSNTVCLSEQQCGHLREYVRGGGVLIASHQTSMADEIGRKRANFGLADVFGVTAREAHATEYPDLYLRDEHGLVPQDLQTTIVQATTGKVLATTYDRGNRRDLGPAVVASTFGKGRSIYLSSGLEAVLEETQMASLREYLVRLLSPMFSEEQSYRMEFRAGVTPHLMRSEKAAVLYLLADVGEREYHTKTHQHFSEVQGVAVEMLVSRKRVRRVSMLRSGVELPVRVENGWLKVRVPTFRVFDAVKVEFA